MRNRHAFVLFALFAGAALAEPPPPPDGQQPRWERLQTELKLSERQTQQVRKIFDETRPQLEAWRKQGEELREKMRERLKSVLTAEQMEKFDEMRRERREHMGRHGHGEGR